MQPVRPTSKAHEARVRRLRMEIAQAEEEEEDAEENEEDDTEVNEDEVEDENGRKRPPCGRVAALDSSSACAESDQESSSNEECEVRESYRGACGVCTYGAKLRLERKPVWRGAMHEAIFAGQRKARAHRDVTCRAIPARSSPTPTIPRLRQPQLARNLPGRRTTMMPSSTV